MQQYIATFYTHLSALRSSRSLEQAGVAEVRLAPVPRALSSSCGTCMRYTANDTCLEHMDGDIESILAVDGEDSYRLLYTAPQPE